MIRKTLFIAYFCNLFSKAICSFMLKSKEGKVESGGKKINGVPYANVRTSGIFINVELQFCTDRFAHAQWHL